MNPTGARHHDQGAAAVEFALVSVLLFTLLFGIIQYGYLFFQYQAAAASAHEGARLAAAGVDDCAGFGYAVYQSARSNGLSNASIKVVKVTWTPAPQARGGTALVEVLYDPTSFSAPFVPFPRSLDSQAVATIENPGAVSSNDCIWPNPF